MAHFVTYSAVSMSAPIFKKAEYSTSVLVLVLFFLFTSPISFNRLAEIGVALQNVGKGLKLVWIHFGKIDFKKFAVHNHLSLCCIVGSL